jgi:tetratricopeptide (TPR) repeat protein
MPPLIDNPAGLDLPPDAMRILRRVFARYKRVVVIKEFTAGLSGSRVLEVRPIKADGTPELPTVVKLATVSMIEQEWQAYQQHIQNRLPHIAGVAARPTLIAEAGWGGLRYPAMGGGSPDIVSLRDFCCQPDVSAGELALVFARLFRIMDNVWGYNVAAPSFSMRASYAGALPPQLLVCPAPLAREAALTFVTPQSPLPLALRPGDAVALTGFAVRKVDPIHRTVMLGSPGAQAGGLGFAVRVRIPEAEPMPAYRVQQIVDLPSALVVETCLGRLRGEVAGAFAGIDPCAAHIPLEGGGWLPNPLNALPELLHQARSVNVATIHGDFNLQNILIEPQLGEISLIDFAEARQDHVLHDLLHLEAEILTHVLPEVIEQAGLDPLLSVLALSWHLRHPLSQPVSEQGQPAHPALRKPWVMLHAIRRAARGYLFDIGDPAEYYQGLTLHLLGTLRYKNLGGCHGGPLPKQIAFWSAALAYQWLLLGDRPTPPSLAASLARAHALWSAGAGAAGKANRPWAPAAQTASAGEAPPDLMAVLPVERIPPVRRLPPGSRVPLERNQRFVGRQEQLKQLAATLKQGATAGPGEASAVAVVGLGGVGKTQLACEFAHRYGSFFAGGVFWLSCADPSTLAAEIAACGLSPALNLRPDFRELPLDEQARLVAQAWALPTPRLLIFDNCEAPELLARWAPRGGGSRLLITSRRADWASAGGVAALGLDVLRRPESVALLREHHPDADGALLTDIAHELGDLPLALHLAGSYLARYRHTVDAAGYLASLRLASPLSHHSLQGGALSPTEHDLHVARTFAFSYDQLAGDEPSAQLARVLLHAAACLAPDEPIPEALARLALDAQHEGAAEVARAGFQLGSAIDQLLELGLLRAEANHTLWLHRLVAAFTRERLGEKLAKTQALVERALCAEAERLNARRELAPLRALQVHLRFVADAAQRRGDAEAADACHAFAEHLYQSGDYRGAAAYHERALRIRQALLGDGHPCAARSLAQLGKALFSCNDAARARDCFERALAIQRAALGDHADTATTLNHLGWLLQVQLDLEAARRCHEQAIGMWRRVGGAEHPAIADSLSNLAYVAFERGDLGASHRLLHEALAVQERARGAAHPETARLLTNLGELLLAQRKLGEAEGVLRQALAVQERALGAEHPDTARTLGDLGDVQRLLGDTERARSYYERALHVFELCHGAEHPRTQRVRAALAGLTSSYAAS